MIREACQGLNSISQNNSRNKKIEILKGYRSKEMEFLLKAAFDPYLTYGINEFDDGEIHRKTTPVLSELENIRNKLANRDITGNAARELLRNTLLCEDEFTKEWLVKVFKKDLSIGIDQKTINKVYTDLIREFKIAKCEKMPKDFEFKDRRISEPKYNGFRCFIVYDGKKRYAQSSNGRELYNIDNIIQESEIFIRKPNVLDGELIGTDWNDTASVAKSSKTKVDKSSLMFRVFDFIPWFEWEEKVGKLILYKRKELLESSVGTGDNYIKPVEFSFVDSNVAAWRMAKLYKEQGFEGSVIKDPNSVYMFDRTKDWLKLKFTVTEDLPIISVEEGTHRNVGRLGAFVCQLSNGNTVNVGGGFSDKQRKEFWIGRKNLLGKIIEVEFQEKTKGGKSIQFPEFVRFRPDKD